MADPSEYVEFYLGNMYAWNESGVARAISYLADGNVDHAHYSFDHEVNWFVIRCLRSDAQCIQARFISLQNDIEWEVRSSCPNLTMDKTFETFVHPNVEMSDFPTQALKMDSTETGFDVAGFIDPGNSRTIALVVPDSLREFPQLVAWQDLQREKSFDAEFITVSAKEKIERVQNVALVVDEGQKVIFIGGFDAEVLALVQTQLSTLLQDSLSAKQPISYLRHVFFVSEPVHGTWKVDIRKIMNVNPDIRKSTILDPWKYGGRYDLLVHAACLRVCLEDPLRKGPRDALWSLGGPFPKSILENQKRRPMPEIFKGSKVAKRERVSLKANDSIDNGVATWLEGVSELKPALPELDIIDSVEVFNPMSGLGDDDPVPLDFHTATIRRAARFDNDEPLRSPQAASAYPRSHPTNGLHNLHILDRDDPVVRDPRSALQRPMLPPRRTLRVAHPDTLPSRKVPLVTSQELNVNQGTELERLVASVQNMLRPMPVRYGVVELRVEIGRFFAVNVHPSGLANNPPNTPARGWEAEALRKDLNSRSSFVFTQALSCFGNDVDYLSKMKIRGTDIAMWNRDSRDVFIDFRFKAPQGEDSFGDFVLEVNTGDYSWNVRTWRENGCKSTFVHCLRQHWDFRVRLSHDHTLEYEDGLSNFAKALIDSLAVSPPKLAYQDFFDSDPVVSNRNLPYSVSDVRIRQVCRLQHHDGKTYLDIARILPTKPTNSASCGSSYHEVATLAPDRAGVGEFSPWYGVSLSSTRLEKLFRQNATLVPGARAGWCADDLAQEVRHLCGQAATLVQEIDPVGVGCDNGFEELYWDSTSRGSTSYRF